MSCSVHLTEVATGETRAFHETLPYSEFMWTEGNYACDCNRALLFSRAAGGDDPDVPCTRGRFLVRIVDDQTGAVLLDETADTIHFCHWKPALS